MTICYLQELTRLAQNANLEFKIVPWKENGHIYNICIGPYAHSTDLLFDQNLMEALCVLTACVNSKNPDFQKYLESVEEKK